MEGAGAQDEAPSALGLLGMLLLANGTEIGLGVPPRVKNYLLAGLREEIY